MDQETSFSAFCHLCDLIEKSPKRDAKLQVLNKYINVSTLFIAFVCIYHFLRSGDRWIRICIHWQGCCFLK